ncbi:MAG: formylglycine-generating enzyme family protein [Magnetococcales bacterium]|nr:formylglycine-generating enzyme family protein [Magnetococcales bacterium]
MKHLLSFLFSCLFLLPVSSQAFLLNEWAEISQDEPQNQESGSGQPTKLWIETHSGMDFIWLPGGCYKMGSPPRADGRDADEQPVHRVCVSGFWMGKNEVTQAQWRTIMRSNPAQFNKGDDHPVERVDFDEVTRLTQRLNKQYDGKAVFRLPTEAEWEYACREGGLRTPYPGVDPLEKIAWFKGNSLDSTQQTGSRLPNRLGLYDMSGNVWEWVQDSYDKFSYNHHQENDPKFEEKGEFRVIRGGSWKEGREALRCANRGFNLFSSKRPDVGVRLVVFVKQQKAMKEQLDLNILPF